MRQLTYVWAEDNDDWFERQRMIQILENHVALEKGVIPCSVVDFLKKSDVNTIDQAFSSMSIEDARTCKRKFRKQLRKVKKKDPSNKLSKGHIQSLVYQRIREEAYDLYDKIKKRQ